VADSFASDPAVIEFARDLADDFIVMDRGAVVISGDKASMVEKDVRSRLSV
jgi:urea transport system ATP-binding protein